MADINSTPDVWAFLREIVARLGAKNPKFFTVLAWAGAIATAISGLPAVLATVPGIHLPDAVADLQSKVVAWCGIVVFVVSNLTVQRPTINSSGGVVQGSNAPLPFTEKQEATTTTPAENAKK